MRLLLFLSAFLTALTGVVTGGAASAQPVEASASIAQAKAGVTLSVAVPRLDEGRGVFTAPGIWRAQAPTNGYWALRSFGERRRE